MRAPQDRAHLAMTAFLAAIVCSTSALEARVLELTLERSQPPSPHISAPGDDSFGDSNAGAFTLVIPAEATVVSAQLVKAQSNPLALEVLGTSMWHGYRLVALRLPAAAGDEWPVPGSSVRLHLEDARTQPVMLQRWLPDVHRRLQQRVQSAVANPVDVRRFAPAGVGATRKSSQPQGFQPSAYPDLDGSPVEYLILTTASLASTFQDLAAWKTRRGVPTVVRDLDFVLANARGGSDQAETVRHFIRDAYQRWGVRWVLLGGDTEVLQARHVTSTFVNPPAEVPTDLYFACLDGTWNANGNEIFGEAATGGMELGDQVDLFPEVFVARAPVTTLQQAQAFVAKAIGYETPLSATYQDSLLLLAEVLSPSDYDTTQVIVLDGAVLTEQLRANVLPGTLAQQRLYETSASFVGSSPLSRSTSLAALELGPHIVNHMGHGFRFNMSVGDGSIVNPEAYALQNGDRSFLLFLLNCTAMAFDGNALGEQFLLAPSGGAVGVVGSSREAFPASSIHYNEEFYRAIYADGRVHLAEAVVECRLPRSILTFFESQDRWTHFILNVLGDPELMLFTQAPSVAVVTHADTVEVQVTSVNVHVEANAAAVDSARVCLWKGDESYAVGWTDPAGDVTLPLAAESTGSAQLTVSGRNLQTYLGSIEVIAPAPAHPYVAGVTVDDDSSGASAGNSDGRVDAGEDIEWRLQVGNNGGLSTAGLIARLTVPPGGDVTAAVDSLDLGDLAPQDSLGMPLVQAAFVLQVDASVEDQTSFELLVAFEDSLGASLGVHALPLLVHAPHTQIVELLPTGASGSYRVVLKNFGSGQQPALTGVLSSTDVDVTILQGNATWAAIASRQEGTSVDTLQVSEADTTVSNPMQLALTDVYGRAWWVPLELRGPAPPSAPALDASPGPTQMRLTWTPNVEADLFGYHVYRRPHDAGPFQRVTSDIVHQSYFRDGGLLPSTRYDYQVVALDSSRVLSGFSAVSTGSTNPAQLTSWPIEMAAATSSSVAIGDIDGDGDLEVVVGDDHVYAWHHTAQEVRDGDNDALSWGVFNDVSFTVTASIALAELSAASPGMEIVAAVWDDNRIFAYDSDGNVLSGWPVQPANGGSPGYWATPTAVDVDGDGLAEVFAVSKDGHCYGFDAAGQPLVGGDGSFGLVGAFSRGSPTIANLDGDPEREIIVAGGDGLVHVWNHDGSAMSLPGISNWPVNLGSTTLCSPVVGEIDGDPSTSEIVLTSENDLLHVFDVAGFELPGWPKAMPVDSPGFAPSPALGDLNNDGHMEIVVVANATPANLTELRVYDGQSGNLLLQKNLGDRCESSPVLGDVDGDGLVDVIVGGESGLVQAWRLDGDLIDGFPLTVNDFVRSTPALCDLDGDGDTELVLSGWDRSVYVWDLTSTWNPANALWPTYAHDMQRSGSTLTPLPTDVDDDRLSVPKRFAVHTNVPNPFNPSTTLRFDLPQPDAVLVAIHDVRGRLVRTVCRTRLPAGRQQVVWDGRDDRGGAVASGVYWYRVLTSRQQATRKMVLIR